RRRHRHHRCQRAGLPARAQPHRWWRPEDVSPELARGRGIMPRTLFDKIWDAHVVAEEAGRPAVLYIDLHLVHEVTSPQAFAGLAERGLKVRRPGRTVATIDHSIPTNGLPIADDAVRFQLRTLSENCKRYGITLY